MTLLLVLVGCTGPMVHLKDGYRHRRHDFRIGEPDGPGPAWERISVDGAALAFRRSGPDTVTLLSRCGRPVAAAQLMARHLVMGLGERTLLAAGPLVVDGRGGWTQTVEFEREGVPLRLKTVTLVVADCTFDWILVASGPFEPAEAAFDAWWGSFQLGARYEEEETAG